MDIWLTLYYILQFLIKLRFPNGTPVSTIICRRYGQETWRSIRKWDKTLHRYQKQLLDASFLEKCLLYELTPKFVRFKLYKKQLHRHQFYREWQRN